MSNNPKGNPTPQGETVTVTLPPGITKEQYLKSHQSWEDQKVKNAKIMRADWRAMATTCKAHAQDYLKNRQAEWRKEGLDPSGLKVRK